MTGKLYKVLAGGTRVMMLLAQCPYPAWVSSDPTGEIESTAMDSSGIYGWALSGMFATWFPPGTTQDTQSPY